MLWDMEDVFQNAEGDHFFLCFALFHFLIAALQKRGSKLNIALNHHDGDNDD